MIEESLECISSVSNKKIYSCQNLTKWKFKIMMDCGKNNAILLEIRKLLKLVKAQAFDPESFVDIVSYISGCFFEKGLYFESLQGYLLIYKLQKNEIYNESIISAAMFLFFGHFDTIKKMNVLTK